MPQLKVKSKGSRVRTTAIVFVGIFITIVVGRLVQIYIAHEEKRAIIRQMASSDNEFAVDAVRTAREKEWLTDGSLAGIDLSYANLKDANLKSAHLRGARLTGTDLEGADLAFADLRGEPPKDRDEAAFGWMWTGGADLTGANLKHANLRNAHLEGTNLSGANLQGADLTGAHFEGAMDDDQTIWPSGARPREVINLDWIE